VLFQDREEQQIMGNTNFISFPKKVSFDWIKPEVDQILEERFGDRFFTKLDDFGQLVIEMSPEEDEDIKQYYCPITFWQESARKIGYGFPRGHFSVWIMVYVDNALSAKQNGKLSSDGVTGTWKGTARKWPDFMSWVCASGRNKKVLKKLAREIYPKELFEF